jgi:hypothetical protein
MKIIVSPYHLTTREAPALAALQIASQVVTMMPTPSAGTSRRAITGAVAAAPKYLDLMESWRWAGPLWEAGLIAPTFEGFDAAADVRAAFEQIRADDRYAALRPLMKPRVFEDDRDYLQAVAADVLKGGPDPAVTVPVAAGLDQFAARHGLAVARATPTSVSQRAEAKLGERVAACAVPLLAQAGAERILLLREVLADELDALQGALESAWEGGASPAALEGASREYGRAFEANLDELTGSPEPDEPRVVVAMMAIAAGVLPSGAVLDSSVEALKVLGLGRRLAGAGRANGSGDVAGGEPLAATMPVVWDAARAPVRSLVFRVIGKR